MTLRASAPSHALRRAWRSAAADRATGRRRLIRSLGKCRTAPRRRRELSHSINYLAKTAEDGSRSTAAAATERPAAEQLIAAESVPLRDVPPTASQSASAPAQSSRAQEYRK